MFEISINFWSFSGQALSLTFIWLFVLDSLKSLFYSILEYFYRWPSSIIQNRVFTVYGHLANPLLPCHFHMVYEWPPRAICKRSAKRHFDLLPKLKCNLEISNRSIATEKFIFSVSWAWDSLIDHALCLNMTVEVACVDKKQSSEFEVREYETNFFIYLRFSSIIVHYFAVVFKIFEENYSYWYATVVQ